MHNIIMNVKKSNKQADFRHLIKQQTTSKTSLRNLKMNRVSRCYKQISPILTECDFDSDKENSSDNYTFEDRNSKQIHDSSTKQLTKQLSKSKLDITPLYSRQLNTQESRMSSQLISIRVPYDTQAQNQIQSMKQYCDFIKEENRRYLSQILKMQAENDVLREEIEEHHCVCQHTALDIAPIRRQTLNQEMNTQPNEQTHNFAQERNELLWKLMELQEENSLQLEKIIELSSGISKQENFMQTDENLRFTFNSIETQTDEANSETISQLEQHKQQIRSLQQILEDIKQACSQFSSIHEEIDLSRFCNWLQCSFKSRLNAIVHPLQCQIKLLNEIIQSNKKTFEEKDQLKAKLLKDAHSTISHLLQQTRQAQSLAKLNYHSFLVMQRKERYSKTKSTLT